MERYVPEIKSHLRTRIIEVPSVIYKATGIKILGTRIKSLLFSTDVAVIKNTNANSIIAVYPFTPQLSITQAILEVAPVPVFVGVGGVLLQEQICKYSPSGRAYGCLRCSGKRSNSQ